MLNPEKELQQYKSGLGELQTRLSEIATQIQTLEKEKAEIINKIIGTNANIVLLQRLVKESKEVKKSVK